jgi:transketolase
MRIDRKILANAIRFLSIDAVEKANSGHPGMPMGMADIAQVLWQDFLRHNPNNPHWPNRDRFILSNGHGSMLQYALLHLTGYDLSIEDIKNFRQLHSRTPGHPEYKLTPGIEVTTGPLGQGLASAVGMALAEELLASTFNKTDYKIIDHYIYCFIGDGCMMEGISHEACAFAGTLGLKKLIVFWDNNGISIDGKVDGWFREDVAKRFLAYGWNVVEKVDGHNPEQVTLAIQNARQANKPTLICCRTVIGYGAPTLHDSERCHGTALGKEEVAATRKALNWEYPQFVIPEEIYTAWNAIAKGEEQEQVWQALFAEYCMKYPELGIELNRRLSGVLPNNWEQELDKFIQLQNSEPKAIASRKASQNTLNILGKLIPELLGGSADLTGSNLTDHATSIPIIPGNLSGNYIHYGVREFAMASIMNGISLHGGFIPYGGTFLTFSDYAKNAIRLSAMMQQKVIYVFTHDSIGLGEDGPTHQPIEHLSMLRLVPHLSLWRPADNTETVVSWKMAIKNHMPTCLALSRQSLPHIGRTPQQITDIERGGYIILEPEGKIEVIIIATGSEVSIALAAAKLLEGTIKLRVISMPSVDTFLQQPASYQEQVLPKSITARVAIEAGATSLWYRFVGLQGRVIGIDSFGYSAPAEVIYKEFKLEPNYVATVIKEVSKL